MTAGGHKESGCATTNILAAGRHDADRFAVSKRLDKLAAAKRLQAGSFENLGFVKRSQLCDNRGGVRSAVEATRFCT